MRTTTRALAIAAWVLPAVSGCSWQQAFYTAGQQWQRNACYRLVEQMERERCLGKTTLSYEAYRSQTGGDKKNEAAGTP